MLLVIHNCNALLLNTQQTEGAFQALIYIQINDISCFFSFSSTKLRIIFITLQCFTDIFDDYRKS